MEAMLTETIHQTRERKVFGQTVFDFQNSKFKFAELKVKATAMRIMVDLYLGEHLRRKLTLEERRSPNSSPPRRCAPPWRTCCNSMAAMAT